MELLPLEQILSFCIAQGNRKRVDVADGET